MNVNQPSSPCSCFRALWLCCQLQFSHSEKELFFKNFQPRQNNHDPLGPRTSSTSSFLAGYLPLPLYYKHSFQPSSLIPLESVAPSLFAFCRTSSVAISISVCLIPSQKPQKPAPPTKLIPLPLPSHLPGLLESFIFAGWHL